MLAAFLANPEKFVDYAGQATEYAVREFAKAGIQLASAVGGGAARGLENLDRPDPRRLRARLSRASLRSAWDWPGWSSCCRSWSSSGCRSAGCSGRSAGSFRPIGSHRSVG